MRKTAGTPRIPCTVFALQRVPSTRVYNGQTSKFTQIDGVPRGPSLSLNDESTQGSKFRKVPGRRRL